MFKSTRMEPNHMRAAHSTKANVFAFGFFGFFLDFLLPAFCFLERKILIQFVFFCKKLNQKRNKIMRRVIAKDIKKEIKLQKGFCCCFLTADAKIWYNFVFLEKDTATNRVWIMFEHVQIVWVIDSHTPMIQRSKRYCNAALMLGKTTSFSWCLEMRSSVIMVLQRARASWCNFEVGERTGSLDITMYAPLFQKNRSAKQRHWDSYLIWGKRRLSLDNLICVTLLYAHMNLWLV